LGNEASYNAKRRRDLKNMPGVRKAAVLILAMGEEVSKEILRALPEEDVQRLTEELADMRGVEPELSGAVMEEFWELLETQQFMSHGGLDYATRLLTDTFGKERADELLFQLRLSQEHAEGDLARLRNVNPEHLGKLLDSEHPQTVALVLAHLDPRRASQVVGGLSDEQKILSIRRLAEMRQFSPEMGEKVAHILHRRLENLNGAAHKSYSGHKGAADLLNRLDNEDSHEILEKIEISKPELAFSIRNLMFTFEDLAMVPPATIRELVTAVDKKTLAMALRGANDELRAQFFKSMSSRAMAMMQEDMEVMGPVRSREVSKAQNEVLNTARHLEASGKVILKLEGGDEMLA